MKSLSLAEAKAKLSEVVNIAEHHKERILIEKRNKPAAIVMGYEDYKKLEALEDIYESKLLEEAVKTEKFYTLEAVAKKVGIEL